MDPVFSSLRRVLRSLSVKKSYVVVSVFVISLSVGALMATTALLNGLLLRRPTARNPQELVIIQSTLPSGSISQPDLIDLQEQVRRASIVFGYDSSVARVALQASDRFLDATCSAVSGNYFAALSVAPKRGRVFDVSDDVKGAEPVAILREGVARSLGVTTGAMIQLFGRPFRVVGLMPDDFESLDHSAAGIWVTLQSSVAYLPSWVPNNRDVQWIIAVARLPAKTPLSQLNAELAVVADRIHRDHPDVNHGMGLRAETLRLHRLRADKAARILVVVSATVIGLFLIGFTNFFSLTLVRLLGRRHQIAVQLALGSRASHLAAWLLGELIAILLLGCVGGYICAICLLRGLGRDPKLQELMRQSSVRLDFLALVPAAAAAAVAVSIIWILALRDARKVDVNSALKEGSVAPARHRLISLVFAGQLALTVALSLLSMRFVATLRRAAARPLPMRTQNVLLCSVDTRRMGWGPQDAKINGFHASVLTTLRRTPGVLAAGVTTRPPLSSVGWTNVWVDGKDPGLSADQCLCDWLHISDGYFEALGVRVQAGRVFDQQEIARVATVAVINRSMAQRYWPNESAVGKTFKAYAGDKPHEVIGVVDDVPVLPGDPTRPGFYYPYTATVRSRMTFLMHVETDGPATKKLIAQTLGPIWPPGATPDVFAMKDQMSSAWSELSTAVRIVMWIAALGLAVTATGMYSFSRYAAEQGARDRGIREALGATSSRLTLEHLQRFTPAFAAAAAFSIFLLIAANACFRWFDIGLVGTESVHVAVAMSAVLIVTLTGLLVPLRAAGQYDLRKILSDQR
ncbi:MAG TPA: ABC transporter permease [Opitutaceae bacterium]|nr:ABC transporter permease [Opitutaceae bacterium]